MLLCEAASPPNSPLPLAWLALHTRQGLLLRLYSPQIRQACCGQLICDE